MAGNDQHAALLLAQYPEAVSAECDGNDLSGAIRYPGTSDLVPVRCPGCAADKVAAAVTEFIPPRFQHLTAYPPPPVTDWADAGLSAQGLYLAGPVGTGKTHTAWAALARWCAVTGTVPRGETGENTRPTVIFTRMTDLLDDLRPGDDARQRVRDCQQAALLVLDDVGAEKASEWTQERLYSVIDHRYANCLPLIVTSNLPPSKLASQTGERAASRLAEMCTVVAMTGTDRRRPGA